MGDGRIERFITEAEGVIRTRGENSDAFATVAAKLRELAHSVDLLDERDLASLHGAAASSRILGRGAAGSVLMLVRFPSEAETPVHDHNSWGVLCVIRGRDRHRRWVRVDS